MKKFFLAFLGTLAGIWLSLFIIFVGLMLVVVAAGVSTLNGVKSVQVKSDEYNKQR